MNDAMKHALPPSLNEEKEIQQLKFLYQAGMPIEKIAEKHGRTVGSIRSRLKKERLLWEESRHR